MGRKHREQKRFYTQDEFIAKLQEIFGSDLVIEVVDGIEYTRFPPEEVARIHLRAWNGEHWDGPLTQSRLWDAIERDRLSRN